MVHEREEGGREDACGLYPTDYEREGGCVKEVLFLFLFSFLSSSSSSSSFLSDFPWLLQPTNFTRLKLEDDSGSKIVTGSCSNCSLAFSGPQLFFFFFFHISRLPILLSVRPSRQPDSRDECSHHPAATVRNRRHRAGKYCRSR